jgi:flagellar biogenesis protein FliO
VDIFFFAIIAVALYFFAAWLLDRIERARGARFKHRDAIYFGIVLTAALLTFALINALHGSG